MEINSAYKIMPLRKQTFFQRLLGRQPKVNAIFEINNLLAQAHQPKDISIDDIITTANKYKVNLYKKFREQLESFYKDYLIYCFSDKLLRADEIENLKHLKHILGLNDKTVDRIHNDVTGAIYKRSINEALVDGTIDPTEKSFIEKLTNDLKLPNEIAQNIYKLTTQEYFEKRLCAAISDERLSPQEEKELDELAKNLDATIKYDEKSRFLLDRCRLYWLIENGDIPEIKVDVNLQRNEKCYFKSAIEWLEERRITRRIQYGGPTLRIKIAKGFYWRMGDMAVNRISEDVLTPIDSGCVYLTNKRLIFMGARKNATINLNKILDFTSYSNGVTIDKETGRSPFLKFDKDVKTFTMILGRVIKDID